MMADRRFSIFLAVVVASALINCIQSADYVIADCIATWSECYYGWSQTYTGGSLSGCTDRCQSNGYNSGRCSSTTTNCYQIDFGYYCQCTIRKHQNQRCAGRQRTSEENSVLGNNSRIGTHQSQQTTAVYNAVPDPVDPIA